MAQARGESLWLMSANQASFSSNHVWHRFTFSSPFTTFSPFSCLILLLFCNPPTHSASLKRTSQPRLMHLGPHLLYRGSSGSNEHNPLHTKSWEIHTIALTYKHSSQSRHDSTCPFSNTCPASNWGQREETTGWFLSCVRGKRSFPSSFFLLHIIWWNCPPAHRRQELG